YRGEDQDAVQVDEIARIGTAVARHDVFHKRCTTFAAVTLPQLKACCAIGGHKEEGAANAGEDGGRGRAARIDVFDHDGACNRAVGLPQLGAMCPIAGLEEEGAANFPEALRVRVAGACVDIPDQLSPLFSAVARP